MQLIGGSKFHLTQPFSRDSNIIFSDSHKFNVILETQGSNDTRYSSNSTDELRVLNSKKSPPVRPTHLSYLQNLPFMFFTPEYW